MAEDFSLNKYFLNQYLKEALSRTNSKYVTPTTSIPKSTSEYITDKSKSNAEKETNAMRSSTFSSYDKEGAQPYLTELNQRTKDLVDGYELDELKSRLAQIYRDMEEEAEPEGGPVADQYADEIDAYEKAIRLKKGDSGREMTYDEMIKKHYGKPPTGVLPSGKPKFDESLNEATDDEIAQALYSVDYEQLEPDEKERVNDVQDEMGDTLLNEVKDDQLSRLLQISKHADIRMGEDKLYKLAMAWENWNVDNDDEYDELVDPLFAAVEMIQDNTAAGMKRANGILKSFNRDIVKVMNSLKEGKLNESEKSWNAIDVSRTAEKELSNKEWNERTAKKLEMLMKLNAAGKFKKDWDEEKLQDWIDKNYSWEKLSQQFKLDEGSCGYTPDGEPRDKPAGSHLLKLKERIFNSFKK